MNLVKKIAKFLILMFLLIVVFNRVTPIILDKLSERNIGVNDYEEDIEELTESIRSELDKLNRGNTDIELPLQKRQAAEYTIVESTLENNGHVSYKFICAVSNAVGKAQRAQTIINLGLDELDATNSKNMEIFLVPSKALCQESRAIGIGYFVPSGSGWKGLSSGEWTWLILTSNASITNQEVEDSELLEKLKPEFKKKYGMYEYSDKLDEFIKNKLGRDPVYAAPGMWNEVFLKE